jgi:hypothetical protein
MIVVDNDQIGSFSTTIMEKSPRSLIGCASAHEEGGILMAQSLDFVASLGERDLRFGAAWQYLANPDGRGCLLEFALEPLFQAEQVI